MRIGSVSRLLRLWSRRDPPPVIARRHRGPVTAIGRIELATAATIYAPRYSGALLLSRPGPRP